MAPGEPRHATPAPPRAALEFCAADLGRDPADLRLFPWPARGVFYKSDIFYVGPRDAPTPALVIKVDSGAYDPAHEMAGLQDAARLLAPRAGEPDARLGVVQPVGWGRDPRFLVTRYQPGVLTQTAIQRAVLKCFGPRPVEAAQTQMRHIARWLGELRRRGTRDDGGLGPETYRAEMAQRTAALAERTGQSLGELTGVVEGYLSQLGEDDLLRLGRSYPSRGDARPKNFLLGEDGVLYGFDMEGFGSGPMEHDASCLHHSLENDGVFPPGGRKRALTLWQCFWNEYERYGSSRSFWLLGYLYFLLPRMAEAAGTAPGTSAGRRLRNAFWVRDRLRWLRALTGDLAEDAAFTGRRL